MKTQKFLLLFCLFIGITSLQLIAQNGVEKVSKVFHRSFELPLYCDNSSERVDVLISNNPYSLWSLIKYDENDDMIWFISHWTDVVFTSQNTGETFTVIAGSERFVANEVYDIKITAIGNEGTKIVLHLSGYGEWGFLDGWEAKVYNCH
jgi:hypothetical protein